MAGQLTIDTLKASSGVLATQNGMSGIAKAWIFLSGGGAPTWYAGAVFNVSSVTYNASGDYNINFTTAMPSANYACLTTNASTSTQPVYARPVSASACRVVINGGANNDLGFAAFAS